MLKCNNIDDIFTKYKNNSIEYFDDMNIKSFKKVKKNKKRISPNNNNSVFENLYGDEDINKFDIKINKKKKNKFNIK